jgi:hypothetical protein
MWWRKRLDHQGAAFFQRGLAPSLESLAGLAQAGIEVEKTPPAEHQLWGATLRHRQWGEARLFAPRAAMPLPDVLITFATGLTQAERDVLARDAQRGLHLEVPAHADDMLRDRKRFLRFLAAVLGTDGIAGFDLLSHLIWTPARLADELAHDAPLDITQLHVFHHVESEDGIWLHSHGLGEMGFVDFDVLRPAPDLLSNQFDVLRSIAFSSVEGSASGNIAPIRGAEPVALVDAGTFMTSASAADRALRDMEDHSERRVVCCDPGESGFFARLFGKGSVRPSRLLSRGMDEERHLVHLSTSATELGAERARESFSLFERLIHEFADLKVMPLVKLGYEVDNATGPNQREHLWFEVHGVHGNQVDATLLNAPFDIARMTKAQRGRHSADLLSDWLIGTPLGPLTPRSVERARDLADRRGEIAEMMAGNDGQ